MDVSATTREAVARVDKFYLLNKQGKRTEAAQEGLDQLARSPELAPAVSLTRAMVAAAPEDARLPMLRSALVHIGERSAALATGKLAPLAGLAVAVYQAPEVSSPSAGKAGLQALAADPLASTLSRAGGGGECLGFLARERPSEPAGLAKYGASLRSLPGPQRVAGQRFVVNELGAGLLQALPDGSLQNGLDSLSQGKALTAAAASGLTTEQVSQHSKLFLGTLDSGWQDWAGRLLASAQDDSEKGRVLLHVLWGAEKPTEAEGRLHVVAEMLKVRPSDPLGVVLSDGLQEISPRLTDWSGRASRAGLPGAQQAQGALAMTQDASLQSHQAIARLIPPEKADRLLQELATDQTTAPMAQGLQAFLAGGADPRQVLALLSKPQPLPELVASLDATLARVADKPTRLKVAATGLAHWQALAGSPDETEGLALLRALAAQDYHDPVYQADIQLRYAMPSFKQASIKGDRVALLGQKLSGNLKNVVDHNQAAEVTLDALKGRHPEIVAMTRAACARLPQEDQKRVLLAKTLKDLVEVANPTPLAFAKSVLKAGSSDPTHFVFLQVATRRLADSASGPMQPQLELCAGLAEVRTGYPAEIRLAVQRMLDATEPTPASLPKKLGLLAQTGTKALGSDTVDQIELGRLCLDQLERSCDLRPDLPSSGVLKQVVELGQTDLATPRQTQQLMKALVDGLALVDTHDPGWLAQALLGLTAMDEASVRALAPGITAALSGAASAYRDDKLAPPVLDKLQRDLAQGTDPRPILKTHLTELARYKGDAYVLLAQTQPETMKTVEEQADAVIVGGVRIRKASE